MKKSYVATISAVLIIALIGVIALPVGGVSDMFTAGLFFGEAMQERETDDKVVAKYKEYEILASAITYNKNMNFMRDEQEAKKYESDRDIVNRIVENIILLEEAERRGLVATEKEIEEMVQAARLTYEIPEGKEFLDQYCEGAGITIEEYFEIIREQAPRTIARQKLKDEIGREYCKANSIEFTKNNPPIEIQEAVDEFISKLLEENMDNITYYIE